MKHENEIFRWYDVDSNSFFPIDYGLKEFSREFETDWRGFKDHVLKHNLYKDILQELVFPSDEDALTSEETPPIPLEAGLFLDCFYQLAKRPEKGYHKKFLVKNRISIILRFFGMIFV